MAQYDIKLDEQELLGLLSSSEQFKGLVESVLNQVLEAQMTEHLGVEIYERSDKRQGYRNGYRVRRLSTRIGALVLRVPQSRDGSFCTSLFKRYQRSEQAFVLGLMEMYLQGVSTRKVSKITEELCGAQFSKSTVSELCQGLDSQVARFRQRGLADKRYPFVIVDALVVDVRQEEQVVSMAVLIAYGINEQGYREIVGCYLNDSESQQAWEQVFSDLKQRGLSGVEMVVSDSHGGLVSALKKHFQGASWQRCQTHFIRNILGQTPRRYRSELAQYLKLIFTAPDSQTARRLVNTLLETYQDKAPAAMDCLEQGLEAALTILQLPEPYRQRLRTTNLAERMNEEIRRRERVIRIFPNAKAVLRVIGALLADKQEEWCKGRKYFEMQDYWDYKQQAQAESHLVALG